MNVISHLLTRSALIPTYHVFCMLSYNLIMYIFILITLRSFATPTMILHILHYFIFYGIYAHEHNKSNSFYLLALLVVNWYAGAEIKA